MILNRVNFFSKTLLNHVDVDILIPTLPDNDCLHATYDAIYQPGRRWPCLYLLHGALDDHSCWLRHTAIERLAEAAGMAVVMPSGQNGFYTKARYGLDYFTFVTEELPQMVCSTFPISGRREDTYIAGPSMGGYGATKCALRCPQQYAAFADFSGAVDPIELEPKMKAMGFGFFRYDLIWGGVENLKNTEDDVFYLAQLHKDAPVKPDCHIYCGLEDTANYGMNVRLAETLRNNGFSVAFTDGHGLHDWVYWDQCIADFLQKIVRSRAETDSTTVSSESSL